MSLYVSDPRSRGKSPSGRDRSRSRDARAPSPPRTIQPKKYYDDEDESSDSDDSRDPRYRRKEDVRYAVAEPKRKTASPPTVAPRGSHTTEYEYDRRDDRHGSYSEERIRYEETRKDPRYEDPRLKEARPAEYTRHSSYSRPEEKPGYTRPDAYGYPPTSEAHSYAPPGAFPGDHEKGYGHPPTPPEQSRHFSLSTAGGFNVDIGSGHKPQHPPADPRYAQPVAYAQPRPDPHRHNSATIISGRQEYRPEYARPEKYQYAEPPSQLTYTHEPVAAHRPSYSQTTHTQVLEVKPSGHGQRPPPSPGLGPRMHSLSVSGGLSVAIPGHGHIEGGKPPGSPLLEAYHGTYQSISPIGTPLVLAAPRDDSDLSDLEPLEPEYSSDDSGRRRRPSKSILKKRVTIDVYDPEPDALALASAIKHSDTKPLIQILPRLTDVQVMEIRMEYKKHMKANGKGINIAKHIKMKVAGNLGKIAYATALGRWESEAYWANFWYQSGTSRRELLIESLMGRTNSEIKNIKNAFSDKRYNDSLTKCMETELKKDKFRNAVLLVLEEKRMEEDRPISKSLLRDDVSDLHAALISKEGGESAMINIIVVRSDAHLREILRVYEATYKKNFAREMINKSRNLVVSFFSP